MPSARLKPFEGLRAPLHIAHRGGAALAPENTICAFSRAVNRHRTDMLELDVHASLDGELIVLHDATLERCTNGHGAVAAVSWEALRGLDAGHRFTADRGETFPFRGLGIGIPRLVDVLEAFPALPLNVELKAGPGADTAAKTLVRLLRDRAALDRVCLGSEDDGLSAKLHQASPDACHFYPAGALTTLVMSLKSGGPPVVDGRYQVMDMPLDWQGVRLVDAPLLAAARSQGLWVNVWTVDAPEEMRYLVSLGDSEGGVGGIMTDRPDLLRDVLDARLMAQPTPERR